jgi:hypothetical protein
MDAMQLGTYWPSTPTPPLHLPLPMTGPPLPTSLVYMVATPLCDILPNYGTRSGHPTQTLVAPQMNSTSLEFGD